MITVKGSGGGGIFFSHEIRSTLIGVLIKTALYIGVFLPNEIRYVFRVYVKHQCVNNMMRNIKKHSWEMITNDSNEKKSVFTLLCNI